MEDAQTWCPVLAAFATFCSALHAARDAVEPPLTAAGAGADGAAVARGVP